MKVAWLIQNLVPYHHARFEAFCRLDGVGGHLIQVTDKDAFGILEFKAENPSYELHTLFEGRNRNSISIAALKNALASTLSKIKPDCVCASGWGMEIGWVMQAWALANKVPVVMFSESTSHDELRRWHKEWIKSRLVKSCRAALVGGAPHLEYMSALGMSPDAVFVGHNVVNSDHFESVAPHRPSALPDWLEREPYFLCCTRFGEKKNLPSLVRSYVRYLQQCADSGKPGLRLAIAGDGELRSEIERTIDAEKVADKAVMLGAVAYADLPWLYQNCQAFVHASMIEQWGLVVNEAMAAGAPILVSERCGCAVDLVHDGENGFRFDPYSEEAIASALWRFSVLPDSDRALMGQASKRIVSDWGPDRFASGLKDAVDCALEAGGLSHSWGAQWLLRLLPQLGER